MEVAPPVATEYTVAPAGLEEDDINRHLFEVKLRRRPGDRWVVQYHERYLDAKGDWEYLTGEDDLDRWRKDHWLTWQQATELAPVEVARLAARYKLT